MFIVSAKLTKRNVLLSVLILGLLIVLVTGLLSRNSSPSEPIPGDTDQQRIAYLSSLGWVTSVTPSETLEFTLPDPLGETYERYNQLQKEQGFDLSAYAGRQVKRFTYQVVNHPSAPEGTQADLYVCDGIVIGGDILCTGPDSFVATLEFPQ